MVSLCLGFATADWASDGSNSGHWLCPTAGRREARRPCALPTSPHLARIQSADTALPRNLHQSSFMWFCVILRCLWFCFGFVREQLNGCWFEDMVAAVTNGPAAGIASTSDPRSAIRTRKMLFESVWYFFDIFVWLFWSGIIRGCEFGWIRNDCVFNRGFFVRIVLTCQIRLRRRSTCQWTKSWQLFADNTHSNYEVGPRLCLAPVAPFPFDWRHTQSGVLPIRQLETDFCWRIQIVCAWAVDICLDIRGSLFLGNTLSPFAQHEQVVELEA